MIDMPLALQHLKADGETVEADLIEQYILSAKVICEGYCNRKFYADQAARDADSLLALDELKVVIAEYVAARADATDCELLSVVTDQYIQKRGAIKARLNGLPVDDAVIAAMLFTLGHLYRNRQEVVAGHQGAAAVQVPAAARRILEPYLWLGDLA